MGWKARDQLESSRHSGSPEARRSRVPWSRRYHVLGDAVDLGPPKVVGNLYSGLEPMRHAAATANHSGLTQPIFT
jgi:hypothetical protein